MKIIINCQYIKEAKEQLVNETADLLHVQYFTAETLLKHFEWSRENLLDQWNKDPFMACKAAGVQPPVTSLGLQTIAIGEQKVFSIPHKYRADHS